MNEFNWNLLDHRWNNFKRWFEAMERQKNEKPFVTIDSLRKMIDRCDEVSEELDDIFIRALLGGKYESK